MKTKKIIILLFIIFVAIVAKAQEGEKLEKEVQVVKPYEPTISDAFKINRLPKILDTIKVVPRIKYSIQTRPLSLDYELDPIKAAKMVGEPLTKLYNGYAKVGIGTKMMPSAQLTVNNLRSKEYSIGASLDHNASYSKVTLDNDSRVYAGFSNTDFDAYGKKFFDEAILSGEFGLSGNSIHQYGHDFNIDTTFDSDDTKQSYFLIGVGVNYRSNYTDSSRVFYNAGIDYNYFKDHIENEENAFDIYGGLNKIFNTELIGVDLAISHVSPSKLVDSSSNTVIQVSPWIGKFGSQFKVQAGIKVFSDIRDDNNKAYFYPYGSVEYDIIDQYIIPYAGIDGKLEMNTYQSVVGMNPFVTPGLGARNTDHKMILFAGLKGNFSSSTYYNIKAEYSLIDNMPFFVNEFQSTDSIGNAFTLEYDNISLVHYFGELSYRPSEVFSFHAKGNYYSYSMTDLSKPWHKSQYDLTFLARYDLRNKIVLDGSIYILGKRSAQDVNGDEIVHDPAVDINLGVEYRYSRVLSAFIRLNNILSSDYQPWNYYPTYGFHATAGLTYSF